MIGRTIAGRYRIESELGRGGRGVVYRARDERLERAVAVKCLRSDLHDDSAYDRFRREALIVARLDHPAIVPVHDFGRHGDGPYLVMALASGRDLRSVMTDTISFDQLIEITLPVLDALAHSHEQGIVHRDIKPENLMVERRGRSWSSRLLDFGIAVDHGRERLTSETGLLGTPHYLSPEQLREESIDGRSDLYSLGAVLYEIVAGRPPHEGTLVEILRGTLDEPPVPPRELGADIPPAFEALILRCLAKAPADRPADARELAAMLQRVHHDATNGQGSTPRRWSSRNRGRCIGRERELARLGDRLDRAIDGRCQLVILTGETGIGKTTILDELGHRARRLGPRVLRGRFIERSQHSFPYHGYYEALAQYFREADSVEPPSTADRPSFRDLAEPLIRLFPPLADVPGLKRRSGWSFEGLSGWFGGRARIFETLAKTITRIAADRPLVLMLEDLHEADVSIEALRYLVHRLGPLPVLFAVTCRTPEHGHPLRDLIELAELDADCCAVLRPGPLSRETLEALLESRLPGRVSSALLDDVHATSGGNPLFATELIQAMAEECDDMTPDGVCLDRLPISVQQALDRRLNQLDQDDYELVALAALLGSSFSGDDLRELTDGSPERRLVALGLLHTDDGERLRFTNRLLRDRIIARLDPEHRRELHQRIVHWLRRQAADEPDRVVFSLAHHAAGAGERSLAIDSFLRAAELALTTDSPDDTVELAGRALALLTSEDESSVHRRAIDLVARGHYEARRDTDAFETIRRAPDDLDVDGALSLVAARAAWRSGRVETARDWVRHGLERADGSHRDALLTLDRRIEALLDDRHQATPPNHDAEHLGELLMVQGDYLAARELFERAHADATDSDADDRAGHRLRLAELATKLGEYEEALGHCRSALAESISTDLAIAAEALAGRVQCALGDLDAAERCITRGFAHIASSAPAGHTREVEARLLRTHGNWLMGRGEPGRALEPFRRAMHLLDGSTDRWERSIASFNLAEAWIALGDHARALAQLDETYLAKSMIGDRWGLAYVHQARARIRRQLGELDHAERDARIGLEIADRLGDPQITARLHLEMGAVLADRGDPAAERHLVRGLHVAEAAGIGYEATVARRALERSARPVSDSVD
ncbi:MAG: protein kinase [Acidobacteriota bacterium]